MLSFTPAQLDKLADFHANAALALAGYVMFGPIIEGNIRLPHFLMIMCAILSLLSSLAYAERYDRLK